MKRLALTVPALAFAAFAFAQAPIPHPIDGYEVTKAENNCLECHDKPQNIGKPRAKDQAPPAPKTHYASGEGSRPKVDGTHFICTGCHRPK